MRILILVTTLILCTSLYAQDVKKFKVTKFNSYSNGYIDSTDPVDGDVTLTLYKNSGTLIIKFSDGETKFTFGQYKHVMNNLYVSIPKAKFYNGGKYHFTGELLINLKGMVEFQSPNGFKISFN